MSDKLTACLTPQGMFEGYQNFTNTACVTGWAWDRSNPHARIAVEVWDGETVLGTITADAFRTDIRNGGIGDGRHAFTYPLGQRIRDRRDHHITVRIAGTGIMLRDAATGATPRPITRRNRPMPAPIPHFSMPPLQRWFYFTLLRRVLRIFPRPVWGAPAIVLGIVSMILDRQGRALNVALQQALGMPTSPVSRWRLHWSRAYQRQADILLLAQMERITPRWAARHVRLDGALPEGGAILVSVHHKARRFAPLVLAAAGYQLGGITTRARDPVTLACTDATLRVHWQLTEASDTSIFGDRRFSRHEAGRKGLRLLAEGGYLTMYADEYARREPFSPLLGRAMTVPRGAVWLAQRSGKPIIPYMVVPEGLHWRVWLGEAAVPTHPGLCDALERCIRQAPGSWQRLMAMAWMTAPQWDERPKSRSLGSESNTRIGGTPNV